MRLCCKVIEEFVVKYPIALLLFISALLSGCSGFNLQDKIPDRRPDYRQSNIGRKLEIPPDLVGTTLNDQLTVPDLNPTAVANYKNYTQDNLKRNRRGYLDVLPELYGVQVLEPQGELPYIVVNADPETTWLIVKKYWEYNGIRLKTQEPTIGLMETDWLEDVSDLPKTGISGLLDSIIQMTHDSGKRDRYRIQFARQPNGQTAVMLIYSQAEEKALRDSNSKETSGFRWQLSDNDNPELQLEMTRRLAVFISAELQRQQAGINTSGNAANGVYAQLTHINGQPALAITGRYAQAWRILGIALDKSSFSLENQDYNTGTYQVSYQPQSAEKQKNDSFFARLWGNKKNEHENDKPQYLLRLADQGNYAVAIVQKVNGKQVSAKEAKTLLETILTAI